MLRISNLPFLTLLLLLAAFALAGCEGTPDRSLAIQTYAPVNQQEGKTTPVMENVFKIRMGVFEPVGDGYQNTTVYKFDDIVKEYISCSTVFSENEGGWATEECVKCVSGDCSEESDPPAELLGQIATCKQQYAEQISAGVLGYAECSETQVLNDERIDSLELPDLPASATIPFTYVVEGFGDHTVESTDCCGNCEGVETSCPDSWTCRTNTDNLQVCMRTMTNAAVARGISPPTVYTGDDQTSADVMFSLVMDFATVTTPDGEASLMNDARFNHESLLLPDGNVLLIGGENQVATRTTSTYPPNAELFDPQTQTFESVTISGWTGGRSQFTLTDLGLETGAATDDETPAMSTDVQRFLLVGGITSQGATNEVYIGRYDSADGSLQLTRFTGALGTAVYQHTATDLGNGQVLIAGGYTGTGPTSEAYIIDTIAQTIVETNGTMTKARYRHTATLMPNGNVAIVGGLDNNDHTFVDYPVEIYNAETGFFEHYTYEDTADDYSAWASRVGHIAVPLAPRQPDGSVAESDYENARIAIYGGYRFTSDDDNQGDGFFYYNIPESANEVVIIAFVSPEGKVEQTPITLNPGYRNAMDRAKTPSPHPAVESRWVWLGDSYDTILLVGGRRDNQTEYSDWAEIITFVGGQSGYTLGSFAFGPDEPDSVNTPFRVTLMSAGGRGGHTLTALESGQYLVAGGQTYRGAGTQSSAQTLTSAEIFNPPTYNRYGNIFQVKSSF